MTLLKIDLVGTMSTPITAPMISPKIGVLITSLIPLPGGPTVKWSQIGAALMFLCNTPSLIVFHLQIFKDRVGRSGHVLLLTH